MGQFENYPMTTIFKDHPILSYLKFSILASLLYVITAFMFIRDDSFASSWILYLGNMLFAFIIAIFIYTYNLRLHQNAKAQTMIFAGHITAVLGILISCLLIFIIFLLYKPGIFHVMNNNPVSLQNSPPTLQGNGHGLMLVLFLNAVIGNISASSFMSIILPFTAKKYQKSNSGHEMQNA